MECFGSGYALHAAPTAEPVLTVSAGELITTRFIPFVPVNLKFVPRSRVYKRLVARFVAPTAEPALAVSAGTKQVVSNSFYIRICPRRSIDSDIKRVVKGTDSDIKRVVKRTVSNIK